MEMSMPLPVCVKCRRQMQKKQQQPIKDPPSDTFQRSVWVGDMFECPECKVQIITDFGMGLSGEKADNWMDKAIQVDIYN